MVALNPRVDGYKNAELLPAESPEVICGGFPCQDISSMGLRAGIRGARSGLWKAMLSTIRLVRPKYAIVENVAALLHRGMGTVLGDLAESGYDTEWHCLPALALGAPHERERIFVVAHAQEKQRLHEPYHEEIQKRLPDHRHAWGADSWDEPHPNFVEWMMGFPIGWSELKPAETPSSPKSPN